MSHFVIIFDRRRPGLPSIEEFDDADRAQARLFEAERELLGDPTRGVVLLYAENEESLRHTHGSYFRDLDELLESAQG
jgi:hypothetical protein